MHLKLFNIPLFLIIIDFHWIMANRLFTKTRNLSIDPCPELTEPLDHLTQEELIEKLTDSCRYDRLIKPVTRSPLNVQLQIDVKHVESEDNLVSNKLSNRKCLTIKKCDLPKKRFKSHIFVQLHYFDNRLAFHNLSPARGSIMGEEPLRNRIWVPHIVVSNERDSLLMGLDGKDVFVRISPQGNVVYSYRMTTNFYCWMNLRKFPFDHQTCDIIWSSWAYNTSNLDLNWVPNTSYKVAKNLHLTEYSLGECSVRKTGVEASFDHGGDGLSGEFSALVFEFKLKREVGYYVLDYFLPSILLVVMSWVTFWIQADVAPARVTLGTATMLSLITLNGNVTKNLPKVSYIKASEIWFFGCATFIFCSLAEFAFVNVIWRRKKHVDLLKHSTKHILKAGVSPRLARKELKKSESFSSLDGRKQGGSSTSLHVPTISTPQEDTTSVSMDSGPPTPTSRAAWTSMTPHEIAIWIDRRSRIAFPAAFVIFNLFYWGFVYAL